MRKEPKKIAARKWDIKTCSSQSLPPSSPPYKPTLDNFPRSALLKSWSQTSTSSPLPVELRSKFLSPVFKVPTSQLSLPRIPTFMSHASHTVPSTTFYKHLVFAHTGSLWSIYIHQKCSPCSYFSSSLPWFHPQSCHCLEMLWFLNCHIPFPNKHFPSFQLSHSLILKLTLQPHQSALLRALSLPRERCPFHFLWMSQFYFAFSV